MRAISLLRTLPLAAFRLMRAIGRSSMIYFRANTAKMPRAACSITCAMRQRRWTTSWSKHRPPCLRLTDCLSVVVAPSLLASSVKQISLVSMSSRRMLMVVVTDDGQVFNRSVEFAEDVSADELADVQNALNAALSGHSISEVRKAEGVRIEALSTRSRAS